MSFNNKIYFGDGEGSGFFIVWYVRGCSLFFVELSFVCRIRGVKWE